MVILIFGDSVTQGYWDEEGGWADRIKRYVMDADIKRDYKGYHGVFNLGIDANFTKDVAERFSSEVSARRFVGADANDDYGLIFAIGVNDTLHEGGGFQSNPEQYRKELENIKLKAKKLTSHIAFVNLLPIDENAKDQATGSEDLFYTNERIELFNDILEKFCNENKIILIDARKLFINNYELFSPDGTHPNSRGHKAIYSATLPIVNSWLYGK